MNFLSNYKLNNDDFENHLKTFYENDNLNNFSNNYKKPEIHEPEKNVNYYEDFNKIEQVFEIKKNVKDIQQVFLNIKLKKEHYYISNILGFLYHSRIYIKYYKNIERSKVNISNLIENVILQNLFGNKIIFNEDDYSIKIPIWDSLENQNQLYIGNKNNLNDSHFKITLVYWETKDNLKDSYFYIEQINFETTFKYYSHNIINNELDFKLKFPKEPYGFGGSNKFIKKNYQFNNYIIFDMYVYISRVKLIGIFFSHNTNNTQFKNYTLDDYYQINPLISKIIFLDTSNKEIQSFTEEDIYFKNILSHNVAFIPLYQDFENIENFREAFDNPDYSKINIIKCPRYVKVIFQNNSCIDGISHGNIFYVDY